MRSPRVRPRPFRPSLPDPRGLLVAAAALLGACTGGACAGGEGDAPPRWIRLAEGFRPEPASALCALYEADARDDGPRVRPAGEEAVWVDFSLAREAWRAGEAEGVYWTPLPTGAGFQHHVGRRISLVADGRPFEEVTSREGAGEGGRFWAGEDRLFLAPGGGGVPDACVFTTLLERGGVRDGVGRVVLDGLVAEGLALWTGESAVLPIALPRDSTLYFATRYRALGAGGEARFRVELDGEPLHESALVDDGAAADGWHAVALPAEGRASARLGFRVEGDPGAAGFLRPVVGPRSAGGYGARPWGRGRPDLVLFLMDTFRADLLAPWGGDPDLAPHLNALAERSVRFANARSPAVWTLPAHASLFAGVFPPQHGATASERALPAELTTVAEVLRRHGYRTGAVTDSGFVSRWYGLDQGFEWFEERVHAAWDLSETFDAARRFLDRDDGRPVFLFVHTYRTHNPYRTGPEESTARWRDFMRRRRELHVRKWKDDPEFAPVLARAAAEFHDLYRAGAQALDAAFGPWLEHLEGRGLFAEGHLVVTSDHGEAFFEHGDRGHQGLPFDEKIRVPLMIHGAGLEPRTVAAGATLVDLPATLAALAGVPPDPTWGGAPLLELERERTLFAFHDEDEERHLAIVDGAHKVLAAPEPGALARGEFGAAFDLAVDPAETVDLGGGGTAWPADLCRSVADVVRDLERPLAAPGSVEMTEELLRRLAEMGYGGR